LVNHIPLLGRDEHGALVSLWVDPVAVGVGVVPGHDVQARRWVHSWRQHEKAAVERLLVRLRAVEVLLGEDQVDVLNLSGTHVDVRGSVHAERSASVRIVCGGDVVGLASPGASHVHLCGENGAGHTWIVAGMRAIGVHGGATR